MHSRDKSPWIVFVPLGVAICLVFGFAGALNVALPAIGRTTVGSQALLPWVIVGYALAVTAPIPLLGRLVDDRGHRTPHLLGLAVFAVASGVCAFAPSIELLTASRVLQGLGAAAVICTTTVLIVDVFPAASVTAALGANAAAAAIGQVAGPIVGGLVVDLAGWRALFLGGAVLAGLTGVLAVWVLPSHPNPARPGSFDAAGAVLSVLALCAVVVLAQAGTGAVPVSSGLVALIAFGVCGAALVAAERRHPRPVLPLQVLRPPQLRISLTLAALGYLIAFSLPLAVSLWLQQVRGESATVAAMHLAGAPVATLLAAVAAPRLARRWTRHQLVTAGFVLFAAGSALVAASLLGLAGGAAGAVAGLVLVGAGNGVFLTPNTAAIVMAADETARGVVNSLRSTAQNAGSLFGPVVVFAAISTQGSLSLGAAAYGVAGVAMLAITAVALLLCRRLRRIVRTAERESAEQGPAVRASGLALVSGRAR